MSGTVPGAGNTAVNQTDQSLCLHGTHILVDGKLQPSLIPLQNGPKMCVNSPRVQKLNLPLQERR